MTAPLGSKGKCIDQLEPACRRTPLADIEICHFKLSCLSCLLGHIAYTKDIDSMAADEGTERELLPAAECPALTTLQFGTLEESCRKAKENAYCTSQILCSTRFERALITASGPYSKFRVGCAILVQGRDASELASKLNGAVITGANVENAAYPVGTCAERVAIGWAVSQGYRPGMIKAVAVSTDLDEHASPCGMCRQFISEFCDGGVPVLMFSRRGSVKVMKVEEVPSLVIHTGL